MRMIHERGHYMIYQQLGPFLLTKTLPDRWYVRLLRVVWGCVSGQ
jgi:hypothetical protein